VIIVDSVVVGDHPTIRCLCTWQITFTF
jgi:hypothetical protein